MASPRPNKAKSPMPRIPPKPATARPAPPPRRPTRRSKKTFSIGTWTGENEGDKVVLYGTSGVGKTSLAAMAPGAVFIGVDDGGRRIRHPETGEPLRAVTGVETFCDVRDALHQKGLVSADETIVVDTLTKVEHLAEPYMFETIKHEKGGTVSCLEGYGYGKGYTHLHDTMRSLLQDLDALVRQGVNVVLICQNMAIRKANPAGTDYLYDGPKLSHPSSEKNSVRLLVCEWADHVINVSYKDVGQSVEAARGARYGKVKGGTTRVLYTHPEPHFFAKSRTLEHPTITFEDVADGSLWHFLFSEGN